MSSVDSVKVWMTTLLEYAWKNPWLAVVLLVVLANLKSFPGMWHVSIAFPFPIMAHCYA